MTISAVLELIPLVALRKESVDRNEKFEGVMVTKEWSLSARRAWIEMGLLGWLRVLEVSRSPQGERG